VRIRLSVSSSFGFELNIRGIATVASSFDIDHFKQTEETFPRLEDRLANYYDRFLVSSVVERAEGIRFVRFIYFACMAILVCTGFAELWFLGYLLLKMLV
jgi:hypothetical protein